MIDEMIERVNRARKEAQNSKVFHDSADEHAEAISSESARANTNSIVKKRKRRPKKQTFASRYSEYYRGTEHDH
ncbi:hypothetical protein ACRZ5S_22920 (plasmid) [Vibrio scophthalmi]|uniref:hypothetical protein n=1 Tax=Vibrio scophthalmi TaxID=45658 RepID=UPI003EBC1FF3